MGNFFIDGFSLWDEDVHVEFQPREVVSQLCILYGIRLGEGDYYQDCIGLFSKIFDQYCKLSVSKEMLGGLVQLYLVREQLPRAVLLAWYEEVYKKNISSVQNCRGT